MNFRKWFIFNYLVLLIFLFPLTATANNSEKVPILNWSQIQETYKFAQGSYAFGEYDLAFGAYQTISLQKKASKKTKALSLKRMGLITLQRGEYSQSIEFLLSAKKELPTDREITKSLEHLTAVKNMDNRDGKSIYIIQVGAFKSSSNANDVIKNIRVSSDNFSLKKHKKGKLFIVYFDGFNNKRDADSFSIKLKSLNESLNFFVKQKDIPDNS